MEWMPRTKPLSALQGGEGGPSLQAWEGEVGEATNQLAPPHPTPLPGARKGPDPTWDMVWLPGGTFRMGSDRHYPEEAPVHRVAAGPFWIDSTPATNHQFCRFVETTGFVTVAEVAPDPKDYPGAFPYTLKPGSLVSTPPRHPVDLRDWSQWWRFQFDANWRRAKGRGRSKHGLNDDPVVQIAYKDAQAYAAWAGKALPTEAEWEYSARGDLEGAEFAWGDELTSGGQGEFPRETSRQSATTRERCRSGRFQPTATVSTK
jgi:formylglycine-generating enzyme